MSTAAHVEGNLGRLRGDTLILTASSRRQARVFSLELRAGHPPTKRSTCRPTPASTHPILERFERTIILPDPGGRRIGSGGSTLLALWRLTRSLAREGIGKAAAEALASRRTLIVHCGGDARRIPVYAGMGKVFIPARGRTMFDLIVADMLALMRPGRVLIASGDVYLGLQGRGLRLDSPAIAGIAFPGSHDRASRHGVYIAGSGGRVVRFLQKPTAARLESLGVAEGEALIDTGVIGLSAEEAARWLAIAGVREDHSLGDGPLRRALAGAPLDLYAEMLPADGDWTRAGFGVEMVPTSEFLHVGSAREALDRLSGGGIAVVRSEGGVRVVGGRAFVDASGLSSPARLAGENVVVGVPMAARVPIELPPGWALGALPIDRGLWTCLAFGIDDDFKTSLEAGGTFGGRPLDEAEARWGPLWREGEPRTLWTARLWCVGAIDACLRHGMALASGGTVEVGRRSLAELVPRIDPVRVIAQTRCHGGLSDGPDGGGVTALGGGSVAAGGVRGAASARSSTQRLAAALARARACRGGAGGAGGMMDAIAEAVAAQPMEAPPGPLRAAMGRDGLVWAESPVRIDLAGGWSDTPPICLEHGGTVLNMAVMLERRAPVRAMARLTDERSIVIRSIDLGLVAEIRETAGALTYRDPRAWDSLPKAALVLRGLCPEHGTLGARLEALGGGLELTIASGVPKGSGMGTSSILGATILACLDAFLGIEFDADATIRRASRLEQMMRTGGGWQDQAGGILPGVKLLRTAPGPDQNPRVTPIDVPEAARRDLAARTILVYTGRQRLAADILQGVVGRYLDGAPEILEIVGALKAGAERTAAALAAGDVDAFVAGVAEYWSLKRRIDPGSTTPEIEAMIDPIRAELSAHELAGAGGGGFLYLIARDEGAVRRVSARLAGAAAPRIFEHGIAEHGLRVGAL